MLSAQKSVLKTAKPHLLFILVFFSFLNTYAQITFEKGYFIDYSGKKVECLIKNTDWRYNPTEFKYKLAEESKVETGNINTVKEFGIYNRSKYLNASVKIDISSTDLSKLGYQKEPIFKEKQLFLNVLLEGKANLYLFVDGGIRRYFFNTDINPIEQLIYKEYKVEENKIKANNEFKQQLWNSLKCETITMGQIKALDYHKDDLLNIFIDYNECNNSAYTTFKEKKKISFNLALRPRLNISSLSVDNLSSDFKDTEFDQSLNFGFGVEAEFVLPFNKRKWAIILEPTYQYYKSETENVENNVAAGELKATVDYSSIETPLGLRYYFFLNDNSKLFINGLAVFDVGIKQSDIKFELSYASLNPLQINTYLNAAFGAGYKFRDKYSLEFRYFTTRDLVTHHLNYDSSYQSMSLILGISIL
ncbi:porin family protein [Mangrovimonas xylaniphaga]|uniref:porin family protein n=1 Tax=Mangrovimonas xylaniphaga TaxID=1645915 RepID=UPI0006B3F9D7|nr:porin family protein [Mangrovimonas xylaniphaga]